MKRLIQFGTFDVSNYGDLLFPLITRKQLGGLPGFNLQVASPIGGAPDMEDCEPSLGILDIAESPQGFDAALIGGGNIIHCLPSLLEAYSVNMRGKVAYGDLWIGPAFFMPENIPILWNAPGVPAPFAKEHHPLVTKALKRADYLSVRDEMSRRYILDVWPDASIAIVPDPAWSVDRLWTEDELSLAYEALFKRLGIQPPQRSVVLHLNRRYIGELTIKALAERLDKIAEFLSARPILIAIGRCHGDDILAREAASDMASSPILLDQPHSLREIAASISRADAYVGSSMHGLITACAFGVPGINLASRSMIKFAGLSEFIGLSDILAEEFDEAIEILTGMDFARRKAELVGVRERARTALELHWSRIRTEISKANHPLSDSTPGRLPGWRRLLDCQNEQLTGLMEMQLRKQHDQDVEQLETRLRKQHDQDVRQMETRLRKQHDQLREQHDQQVQEMKAQLREQHVQARKKEEGLKKDFDREKRQLNKHVQQVQAEIKNMRSSLSWKATVPLRFLSHRFPHMTSKVHRVLGMPRHLLSFLRPAMAVPHSAAPTWSVAANIVEQIHKYQQSQKIGRRKIVLYTAVYGKYDNLLLPESLDEDVDYVCFTDQPRADYGFWQMRASPYYHTDSVRIARYVKTHPHELFPLHDVAVWLDANIILRGDLKKFIDLVKNNGLNFGLVPHPVRDCFFDEAEACKRLRKDDPSIIDGQVEYYRRNGIKSNAGMFETGFMVVFLHDRQVLSAFKMWWQQIERFSRRDQLSLPWVLLHTNLQVAPLLPEGISVREDKEFLYFGHEQCRKLRVPEVLRLQGVIRDPLDAVKFIDVRQPRLDSLIGKPVDIIICVYNALEDVRLCLTSVRDHLCPGHRVIIVNDFSDEPTSEYLRKFIQGDERIRLIENKENLGYTRSANLGLAAGTADFRILLNSDTIVSENWALKMLDAVSRNPDVGIVGPLSNAAGTQSIPDIKGGGGNTAINTLPPGVSLNAIDIACERWSFADLLPQVPLVHGFCFGVKKEVIDRIGFFDDENFKRYYGEENDYCFRARAAGFNLVIATHTFVYHRKSRSIEEEERIIHMAEAGKRLREIYGAETVKLACRQIENHPILERIRREAQALFKK